MAIGSGRMDRKEYQKLYHKKLSVIQKKKKYFKEYNARPEVKEVRHEWYIQKKIEFNSNDYLNAQNTEAFAYDSRIQTPVLLDKLKERKPRVSQRDSSTIKNNKVQKKAKALDKKQKV